MGHCEDNHRDRELGAYWERRFCRMARNYGHAFTPHQFGRDRRAACAYHIGGHIILPDITIWSSPGQHHEVKHKNPTRDHRFGLETYRFTSLLQFAEITGQPVYYTIHNWEAAGRDNLENRILDWYTCDTDTLLANQGISQWGDSWVNGEKKRVPILYWPVTLFRPLIEVWVTHQTDFPFPDEKEA
jgi:hypothetical protein